MTTFDLHEDFWAMIDLMPIENAVWAENTAREAEQAARENFAGFVTVGDAQVALYNNMFRIPKEEHPLRERNIRLDDLRTLLADTWPEAAKVTSGYSSYVEEIDGAFAFGHEYDAGSFYGSHEDGIVTALHILRPRRDDTRTIDTFAAALTDLGRQYDLMLADWWTHTTVDLRDPAGIRKYLEGRL